MGSHWPPHRASHGGQNPGPAHTGQAQSPDKTGFCIEGGKGEGSSTLKSQWCRAESGRRGEIRTPSPSHPTHTPHGWPAPRPYLHFSYLGQTPTCDPAPTQPHPARQAAPTRKPPKTPTELSWHKEPPFKWSHPIHTSPHLSEGYSYFEYPLAR